MRQQRVLLGFVETVDFVYEEDGALAELANAANAVRPLGRKGYSTLPTFAFGWPTSENAPLLFTGSVLDVLRRAALGHYRTRNGRISLVFKAITWALLGLLQAEARAQFQASRGQPRLQDLFILSIIVTMLGFSILNMMAAIADKMMGGDASTLGTLMAASGGGAFTTALVILPLAQSRKHIGRIMAGVVVWMGCWYIVLSFAHWLPLAMLSLFAFSLGAPLVVAMSLGLIQVLVPFEMRARLVGLFNMVSFGLQPFSFLLVGASAERFGLEKVILVNGSLLVLGGMAMLLLRRGLRQWEVHEAAAPPAPASHYDNWLR